MAGRWADVRVGVASAAPADQVFGTLTDWPRHREWMPLTTAEGGHGVGATITGRTGLGPVRFVDTMVITGWEPGRRVAVVHTGRLVKGDAWFAVEPSASGGSLITWAEHVRLPLGVAGRLGWALIGPAVRHLMRVGLRRLARCAERTPPD